MALATGTADALTRDEAVAAVTSRYRLTSPSFLGGFSEIGTVLAPRREGLRVNRASKLFRANLIDDHRLMEAGGSDLPLGGAHAGVLSPGERLHLYGVRTGDDYVQLDLFTVATYVVPGSGTRGPAPLQASVRFRYGGGLAGVTAQRLLADIDEWLVAVGEQASAATPAVSAGPAPEPRAAGRATGTVRLGQTPEEVAAVLGPPDKRVLLGRKTIYIYPDLKVIFFDGRVVDAE